MKQEKWFERTFDLTVPIARFPSILERLRGTPARLEERTASLSPAVLTQRHDNRWSVQENVGHLLDLEPLWFRRTEQLFAGDKELVAADLTNRRTHEAHHNDRNLTDLLRDFRTARTQLVCRLAQADDGVLGRSAIHPRLRTPMRLVDVALFIAEHDDHHLATIAALLAGSTRDGVAA
ncbi:MAG TPA: DinB family protein [Casimicrobiaceae bacterium]